MFSDRVVVQDNLSRSCRGTVRGLHYQLKQPQGKLVSVLRGAVLDVAVDIRRGSPTFGNSGVPAATPNISTRNSGGRKERSAFIRRRED